MSPSASHLSLQDRNLFQQGYQSYTPQELRQLHWGLRFTPMVCSLLTVIGLVFQLPGLLLVVASLGLWAFFFPAAHPMDLLYNHGVRHLFGAVALPPNPLQRRLACLAAGTMNLTAAVLFLVGQPLAAWIVGGVLLLLQAIVITTHFCVLSWIYEAALRALGRWAKPIEDGEATSLLASGATVVDVRGPDEYAGGHVPGAINVPLESLAEQVSVLADRTVLVYCRSGLRSQIACQKLRFLGLKEAHDLGSLERARRVAESVSSREGKVA